MAQHCEPEILALRALGEPAGSGADDEHLRSCARCQAELDQLQAVAATSRTVTPADIPQAPSPDVWNRVVGELGLPANHPPAAAAAVDTGTDSLSTDRPATGAAITPLRRRRIPTWAVGIAAAVAGVAIGVAGTLIAGGGDEPTDLAPVVASATLDPVPAGSVSAAGSATVDEQAAGRVLSVSVDELPDQDGFYEVWLLDTDAQRMVPVGILNADQHGSFVLPAGLDLSDFPVVDVSLEPYDGNPAHSSDSVSRGILQV